MTRHFVLTVFDVPGGEFFISKMLAAQHNASPQILQCVEVDPKIWRAGPLEGKVVVAMTKEMLGGGGA